MAVQIRIAAAFARRPVIALMKFLAMAAGIVSLLAQRAGRAPDFGG
jgi:hypothetical protein